MFEDFFHRFSKFLKGVCFLVPQAQNDICSTFSGHPHFEHLLGSLQRLVREQVGLEERLAGCLDKLERMATWRERLHCMQQQYGASILHDPGLAKCTMEEISEMLHCGDMLPDEVILLLLEREAELTEAWVHDLECQMKSVQEAAYKQQLRTARVSVTLWISMVLFMGQVLTQTYLTK